MSEERFGAIAAKLEELSTGQRELQTDVQDLKTGVQGLGHQMRVLHEDTIDRIAALAPDFSPIRREFTAADTQLREEIDRRLTPLEADARRRNQP